MSIPHEDLVAFALGQWSDDERAAVQGAVDSDPRAAAELAEIRAHLRLHDRVPVVTAPSTIPTALRARIASEPASPSRGFLARYWTSVAAAALVLLAVMARDPAYRPSIRNLHGRVESIGGQTWKADRVSRIAVGEGLVMTLDADTEIAFSAPQRLALRAGRAFFEVEPSRLGFRVQAHDVRVVTTGTSFLVDVRDKAVLVRVVSGTVRCDRDGKSQEVGKGGYYLVAPPGEDLTPYGDRLGDSPRAWFRTPTLSATLETPESLRVVLRNDMPDPITVPAPTGGEPMFFASYRGEDFPLQPNRSGPVRILPGKELVFTMRLPKPAADGEALLVSCRSWKLRVSATRSSRNGERARK